MMSVDDVTNILGIPLLGIIPESEEIIISSNRGEPLILEDKPSLPSTAFDNLTRRLLGEDLELVDLNKQTSKNPVKRILRNLLFQNGNQ